MTDFPKIGDRFPQSRWLIFPKSVAHFPKVGDRFPQSWWNIFIKSVAHFSNNRTNHVVPNTWHCFFPKTECDLSTHRSKAFAQSATFQNQLKVATKVVLLLGGNISCMFSRKAGVWIYHFSGSSKSYQRFPPCAFLVSCWNRAQTVFVGKWVGRLTGFLVF